MDRKVGSELGIGNDATSNSSVNNSRKFQFGWAHKKAIERVFPARNNVFVDLATLDISHYDYNNFNRYDAFIPLAEKMLQHQN
jgi:hypothetical protein